THTKTKVAQLAFILIRGSKTTVCHPGQVFVNVKILLGVCDDLPPPSRRAGTREQAGTRLVSSFSSSSSSKKKIKIDGHDEGPRKSTWCKFPTRWPDSRDNKKGACSASATSD
ncbi:unnamed protein product, partial [Ectocarpus sp. 12 AP-2014]